MGILSSEGLHSILLYSFCCLCRFVSCPGIEVLTFPLAWHVPVALPQPLCLRQNSLYFKRHLDMKGRTLSLFTSKKEAGKKDTSTNANLVWPHRPVHLSLSKKMESWRPAWVHRAILY